MPVDVKNFNLDKKLEVLDRFLLTKGLRQAPVMRVGAALDISMSMANIIQRGDLQRAFDQLMGVSYKFDDNGELDVFKFDTQCEYVGTSSPADYTDFVARKGIKPRGGTSYAPIVRETSKFFYPQGAGGGKGLLGMFSKAPAATGSKPPAMVMVVTDGDCNDAQATMAALQAAQKLPMYFHFVGVGKAAFPTIKWLADELPNVGDVYLRDFGLSDEDVYSQIISDELVEFIGRQPAA